MIAKIRLSDEEYQWAKRVGIRRRYEGGDRDNWPHESLSKAIQNEILGAAGELAVAVLFSVEWEASVNRFRKDGDVCGLEVRTSRWVTRSWGLKVKPWEAERKPEMGVVWVVADPDDANLYFVTGWVLAGVAPGLGTLRDPSHGKDPEKATAWFVEHEHLSRNIDKLRTVLEERRYCE